MNREIKLIPKSSKWIFIFNGTLFFIMGLRYLLFGNSGFEFNQAFGISFLVLSLLTFGFLLVAYSAFFGLEAKIQIDQSGLNIKESLSKRKSQYSWESIDQIHFQTYAVKLCLKNGDKKAFKLQTSADISKEIKLAIREMASDKDIEVISG